MLGYSTLEAPKPWPWPFAYSLSHRTQKTEPLKKNPVTHSHSRHTRMPSSRHVGGYLMLCREDCCCEEGLLSKQEEELLNHRNRKECGLDA
jgi:hypothetical protein